jgi:hypothetical protein
VHKQSLLSLGEIKASQLLVLLKDSCTFGAECSGRCGRGSKCTSQKLMRLRLLVDSRVHHNYFNRSIVYVVLLDNLLLFILIIINLLLLCFNINVDY